MSLGNIVITANVEGGADGSWTLGPTGTTRVLTAPVQIETQVVLAAGTAQSVTVPTGASAMIIVPPNATPNTPNTYAGNLTLKGASADTGVSLSTTYPTAIQWDTAPSAVWFQSSAAATVYVRFL